MLFDSVGAPLVGALDEGRYKTQKGGYKTRPYGMDTNQYKYHRHSIRLKNFDYSSNGAYFITICTQDREMLFGDIVDGKMETNNLGNLVVSTWELLPDRFPVIIDTYQIMPNHFHGIVIIDNSVKCVTLGNIIGAFKSLTTNAWGNGKFWQRNYYEHIIRNEKDLDKISQYILDNPLMWDRDKNNPQAKNL